MKMLHIITLVGIFSFPLIEVESAPKTYELKAPAQIQELLQSLDCTSQIMRGSHSYHPVSSALLAGYRIGKLIVTDDDSIAFLKDAKYYKIKRVLELHFVEPIHGEEKLVLTTKPCGAEPLEPQPPEQDFIFEPKE
jgi:hypothetical protein